MATLTVAKTAKPVPVHYAEKHSPDYRAYADAKYGWQNAGSIPTSVYILGGVALAGLGIWLAIRS